MQKKPCLLILQGFWIKIKQTEIDLKNKFNPSISVTPGTPPNAAQHTDTRLTGRYTPVKEPVRFTAISVKIPIAIESRLLLNGCLLLLM